MPNTDTEYVVTECPNHGVKVCGDIASMQVYVQAANACITAPPHLDEHRYNGEDCWICCPAMIVDPHGVFDTSTHDNDDYWTARWTAEEIAQATRN